MSRLSRSNRHRSTLNKRLAERRRRRSRVSHFETLERRDLLALTFEFNYTDGANEGFNIGGAEGMARRTALESAAAEFGSWFNVDRTVQIEVNGLVLTGGRPSEVQPINEFPSANFAQNLLPNGGLFRGHTGLKIRLDQDRDADGNVCGNSDQTCIDVDDGRLDVLFNSAFPFELSGKSADVGANEVDFRADVFEALIHMSGFDSFIQLDGSDQYGTAPGNAAIWTPYDVLLSDKDGNVFIDQSDNFKIDGAAWTTHSANGDGLDAVPALPPGGRVDGPCSGRWRAERSPGARSF